MTTPSGSTRVARILASTPQGVNDGRNRIVRRGSAHKGRLRRTGDCRRPPRALKAARFSPQPCGTSRRGTRGQPALYRGGGQSRFETRRRDPRRERSSIRGMNQPIITPARTRSPTAIRNASPMPRQERTVMASPSGVRRQAPGEERIRNLGRFLLFLALSRAYRLPPPPKYNPAP